MTAKRLGALGTLVRDTIHLPEGTEAGPSMGWGGIAYGLEALEVALPSHWEVIPLVRVGADRVEDARAFLGGLGRAGSLAGVRQVPEETNRVEIRYRPDGSRTERLSGGVPPWPSAEVADAARGLDALYVNFISGFELELEGAEALREAYAGPIYADLHSLFLSVDRQGFRRPQALPHRDRWLQAFDAVQVNEEEFRLLAGGAGEAWHLAAQAVCGPLHILAVTLGRRGAATLASETEPAHPLAWGPRSTYRGAERPVRRFAPSVPPNGAGRSDPTGCGDVWGATFFARLLAGDPQRRAMAEANRSAGCAAAHRGAEGLRDALTAASAGGSGSARRSGGPERRRR